MPFKACGAFLVLGNARAGRPPGRGLRASRARREHRGRHRRPPGRGLVASGRIENPAEPSDGLKPGVYGITGVFGFHAAIGEPRAYAPDARTARTGRTAWEHPERITPMTKKNIAETNKFAEYLGIATDTLRGIMGNDCELLRRAEHKAIDMGEDGRLARERMRERLRRRPSRGHVDVIAWFLAFAPECLRDGAELARAVDGTRTWAKASDLAREFDVSAKTLGRWARGEGRGKAGRVRSIRVRRTLLLRVDEIAGLRPKRRPTDGGIAGKRGTGDVEGPLDGLAPLRAVPTPSGALIDLRGCAAARFSGRGTGTTIDLRGVERLELIRRENPGRPGGGNAANTRPAMREGR